MINYPRAFAVFSTMVAIAVTGSIPAVAETALRRPGAFKVLFIGNSHLSVNNVPARVQARLRTLKGPTGIKTFAYGGARLSNFIHRADVAAALKGTAWDAVVLQEATASFLTPQGRRRFHQSVAWFSRKAPPKARIVLYQTWPWRKGSRFLRGTSSNATQLWRAMQTEFAKVARRSRVTIAPVGPCWVSSARRNTYYSADGNHATVAGSRVAAAIIARTIARSRRSGC